MGWIEVLQDKVSSLYSNVTVVKSEDDKRVEELINRLKNGFVLSIMRNNPIEVIYKVTGNYMMKKINIADGGEERINVDEFSTPLGIYLENNDKNSILIMHKFLKIPDDMQALLLAISRDTELMKKNMHIILFTENILSESLMENVNIVNVPLSTTEERKMLIEDFVEKLKTKYENDIFEDTDSIIRATSGLNLIQYESLLYEGIVRYRIREDKPVPASWFAKRKVEMLNTGELFSIYTPKYGMDAFASPKVIRDYINNRIIKVIKEYERAKGIGLRFPDGLLLFGMQGTGKTLLARAIAYELNIPFVEFNIAGVLNKYVGETEKHIDRLIKVLEAIQPAVLFIDEIDALGMKRGDTETDSGVRRNMINKLMSWMAEEREVLIIGSTNRPQDMDEAFIRSGRLSFKIPLLLPNYETRMEIFKIHMRLRNAKYGDINFGELAEKSEYFTGADIVKVLDDALFNVFINNRDELTMEDFDEAFKDNVVNIERNRELQQEYIKLANQYGTSKKIISIYTTKFTPSKSEKIELLKQFVKG